MTSEAVRNLDFPLSDGIWMASFEIAWTLFLLCFVILAIAEIQMLESFDLL
jgi:hypothetical protein